MSSACRAFEDALLARLDESGPDAAPPPPEGHAAGCGDCRSLLAILAVTRETFGALQPPRPAVRLMRSLGAPPADFPLRREAADVLDLLAPGGLVLPEPSEELMGRLRVLPTRRGGAAPRGAGRPAWRRLLGDWRVTVAIAYAAALLFVAFLGIDPMSAARGAASSLTSVGERAMEEARSTALARLETTARAEAAKPLTERLDYRIYRMLVAGKARATAYAQMAFEKIFGGSPVEASPVRSPAGGSGSGAATPRRPTPRPEPNGKVLRS